MMRELYNDKSKTILSIAVQKGIEKSTCPSEIARMIFSGDWRKHMKAVRSMTIDMHPSNKVIITQKGFPSDVHPIKRPLRIKIV